MFFDVIFLVRLQGKFDICTISSLLVNTYCGFLVSTVESIIQKEFCYSSEDKVCDQLSFS